MRSGARRQTVSPQERWISVNIQEKNIREITGGDSSKKLGGGGGALEARRTFWHEVGLKKKRILRIQIETKEEVCRERMRG